MLVILVVLIIFWLVVFGLVIFKLFIIVLLNINEFCKIIVISLSKLFFGICLSFKLLILIELVL